MAMPADIIDFANSRGADQVLYAGYFPTTLSLERMFRELPDTRRSGADNLA